MSAFKAAEARLKEGEIRSAESSYRSVLLEGWLFIGDLEAAEGHWDLARQDFERASTSAVETRRAYTSLAVSELRLGDQGAAVNLLTHLATRYPKEIRIRRLLARALDENRRPEEAVQTLREARELSPRDAELTFNLAELDLEVHRLEEADRLFAEVSAARPIPQTQVLIGSAYLSFGEEDRARKAFVAALKQDPGLRHAHYYLGLTALSGAGGAGEAVAELEKELRLAPEDPAAHLYLGIALAESGREKDALPHLERASRDLPDRPEAWDYLARCALALGEASKAKAALDRALALVPKENAGAALGLEQRLAGVLQTLGASEEAAKHSAEAERLRTSGASDAGLASVLRETLRPNVEGLASTDVQDLSGLDPKTRAALRAQVNSLLVRAYLNLGIMALQGKDFRLAKDLLEGAERIDPDFPQLQQSLGVAYFSANEFEKAKAPLARALGKNPFDLSARHMLALALVQTEAYDKAAALLSDDSDRARDPSLEYVYGMALVRGGRAAEAQALFSKLLREHGDSPEVNVVLGQAYAEQGDFPSAIESLRRALSQNASVPDANGALGVIYLKQGRLDLAEAALRSESALQPADLQVRFNLAKVLELEQKPEEARGLLRSLLAARPESGEARYLLGKILLAEGRTQEALEQLQSAARLSPKDANVHFQLGNAYQKLGQTAFADAEFEIFRDLKDRRP
jgi:Flp pilus assembly protein TadD